MKLLSERNSAPSPPRSTPLSFSSLYYLSEKTPALLPRAIFTQHARHINWKPESSAAPKGTPPYLDYGLHPVVSTLRPTLVTSAPTLYHHNTVLFIPCMCFTPPNTPPSLTVLSFSCCSIIHISVCSPLRELSTHLCWTRPLPVELV